VDDPKLIEYGRARYVNELNRLCGVAERRLSEKPFLASEYSIADMAAWPWLRGAHRLGQSFDDFPKLKDWVDRIYARPAVERALKVGESIRASAAQQNAADNPESARFLFGQTAQSVADAIGKQS
jgi:glutathione S-transferase